jgi:hypothetical protein
MRLLLAVVVVVLFAGCSSKPVTPVQNYHRRCEPTPITVQDLKNFNITPMPGKVMVVRFLRSACPFCQEDLQQLGLMYKIGKLNLDQVKLALIAYKKEGVESRETFETFVRSELAKTSFPLEKVQIVFLDRTHPELLTAKSESGDLLLADWKAVPYSLIFAKDGRLAYRGHFSMIPSQQHNHYDFITFLQNEKCPGKATQ